MEAAPPLAGPAALPAFLSGTQTLAAAAPKPRASTQASPYVCPSVTLCFEQLRILWSGVHVLVWYTLLLWSKEGENSLKNGKGADFGVDIIIRFVLLLRDWICLLCEAIHSVTGEILEG